MYQHTHTYTLCVHVSPCEHRADRASSEAKLLVYFLWRSKGNINQCVCACVRTYIYVCTYIYMYVCTHFYDICTMTYGCLTPVCVYVHAHTHTHKHTHTYTMCLCVCVRAYIHVYTYLCTHVYGTCTLINGCDTQVCEYTHTHTHVHTICVCVRVWLCACVCVCVCVCVYNDPIWC